MAYKDKHDPRYREARMRWYFKNKAKHRATIVRIIKEKRKYINELKNHPCADCGVLYPYYVMDFDHREKKSKNFTIGLFYDWGWKLLKEEIEKCDIVCANCHRMRTYKHLAHSSIG